MANDGYLADDKDLLNASILIVDDVEMNIDLLARMLRREGFTDIRGLSDPRLVLGACEARRPDLILMDIRMPGLDGFEVMEILNESAAANDVPVIVLTAERQSEGKQRAMDLGAMDFIEKPLSRSEAMRSVRSALHRTFGNLFNARRAPQPGEDFHVSEFVWGGGLCPSPGGGGM